MITIAYPYGVGGLSVTKMLANSEHAQYGISFGRKTKRFYYDPDHPRAKRSGRVYVRSLLQDGPNILFRHGWAGHLEGEWTDVVNRNAMHVAANKLVFRRWAMSNNISVPHTWVKGDEPTIPCVGRPLQHSKGIDFNMYNTMEEYENSNDGYYSELLSKRREYRVHVFGGYAYAVSKKIPNDGVSNVEPWNYALNNATFKMLNNTVWPMASVRLALECMHKLRLFYGGVDVIVADNTYICEVNTAATIGDGELKAKYVGKLLDKLHREVLDGKEVSIPDPAEIEQLRHPWLREE